MVAGPPARLFGPGSGVRFLMPEHDLKRLMALLDHQFADQSLIRRAVTHPSLVGGRRDAARQSYQRLEFLGDRVLGLVVADMLLRSYPDDSEGDIAKRHAGLVRAETLAEVASRIGIGDYLRLSTGEIESGGRRNPAILADACEAIIGALYVDAGLPKARGFIEKYWKDAVAAVIAPPREPKTALQEWAQARALPLPEYRMVDRTGPAHNPLFVIEVTVRGHEPVTASASSKRVAEKEAALELLRRVEAGEDADKGAAAK